MAFPTTRWSLLHAAGDPDRARAAWSELAEAYRPAIVSFCAARFGREQGEDLAQQFFAESIAQSWWARADAERGSFRTYLRVLLVRFGERHGARFSMTAADDDVFDRAAERIDASPAPAPEQAYDAAFASLVVSRARAALLTQVADDAVQRALVPVLLEGGDHGGLKELADRFGMPQNTVSQRLRRLRQRFRDLLRAEIGDLVASPEQVDQELTVFLALLRQ